MKNQAIKKLHYHIHYSEKEQIDEIKKWVSTGFIAPNQVDEAKLKEKLFD